MGIFCNSIHLEVASSPFCLLINSPWLLVFALCLFFLILSGFNLYCWKGIHFSWSYSFVLLLLHIGLIFPFHFWFRDLLRELDKKYEVLLIIFFLVFLLFLVSEGLLDGFIILLTSIFTFFFFGEIRNLTTLCLLNNNGFSLSSFFLSSLSFLWIGAQFPQEKFLSYARILTLYYYFLLMCILFPKKKT